MGRSPDTASPVTDDLHDAHQSDGGWFEDAPLTPTLDRLCQDEAGQAADHLWKLILEQEASVDSESVERCARRFCHVFTQTLYRYQTARMRGGTISSGSEGNRESEDGRDCVDSCADIETPPSNGSGMDGKSLFSKISPEPSLSLTSPKIVRRASVPFAPKPGDIWGSGNQLDSELSDLPRTSSDASHHTKSSFLRRMSFKGLFAKPSPDAKHKRSLPRVFTSGSLFPDITDQSDGDSQGSDRPRPRLSSAPASELARLRPYKGASTAPNPVPAQQSSLFNLPQRLRKNSVTSVSGRQSPLVPVQSLVTEVIPEHDAKKASEALAGFPWYHPLIGRSLATSLVLGGPYGTFLVRPSESRPGEFVLTFNDHGKSKHIRFDVTSDGRCRLQSRWFESVPDLLDHYRNESLPLESDHSPSAFLSEHIPVSVSNDLAYTLPPLEQGKILKDSAYNHCVHPSAFREHRFCRSVSPLPHVT